MTLLPIFARSLVPGAFANKVDGWLVWTVSRWNDNKPITSVPKRVGARRASPATTAAVPISHGTGRTIPPTLRAEAIRDGIEDYEYFTMLKKLSEKRGKSDPLRIKAEALLDSLSRHPGTSAEERNGTACGSRRSPGSHERVMWNASLPSVRTGETEEDTDNRNIISHDRISIFP